MPTLIVEVPDMSCGHCEAAVTRQLGKVDGVRSVVVDLVTKLVEVEGAQLDIGAITEAIDEAGFEVAGYREVR